MKTFALLFSADVYEREELEKMTAQELYDLACAVGYDEASVLTLEEFSTMANNEEIFLDYVWLYFVSINQ